ncbi:hypothetical protein ACU5DF_02610 [Aliivibrio wodanis]|uniref:hypothetical protein n=1 Tax=Aliivibrio wodanis TaxID=80852 RepID=UPI00406D1835
MSKSTESIMRLVKAGGNLSVDAKGKSTESILRIAKVATLAGNVVTFRNLEGKSTDSLLRIIKAGGKHVHLVI